METDNDEPKLVELGANQRGAPDGVNLDVRGTVGPDHLGQETVDVDGHPCNRPGVRNRMPESGGEDDPRIARMDTGEELPVLLSSDMSADPIEGVQGTYTQIIEGECPRCGYDRLKVTAHTLAGEAQETCNACGARVNRHDDGGYRMPTTSKERAQKQRDAGTSLGTLHSTDVVDLEDDTGWGPMITLVESRSYTSLYKDDVADLFWMLVDNDDIDLLDTLDSNLVGTEKAAVSIRMLPEGMTVTRAEDEQDDD